MGIRPWVAPAVKGFDPRVDAERRREQARRGGLECQRLIREGRLKPSPVVSFTTEQRRAFGRMGVEKRKRLAADGKLHRRVSMANIRRFAALAAVGGRARWAKADKEKEAARLRSIASLGGRTAKANRDRRARQ